MTNEVAQSLVYAALPRRQMRIAQLGDGTVGADGLFDCCGVVVCAGPQHNTGARLLYGAFVAAQKHSMLPSPLLH